MLRRLLAAGLSLLTLFGPIWMAVVLQQTIVAGAAWAACAGASPTLTAASNALTDVQDCVTAAAASGDTINVPAGTGSVTWTAPLVITNKCLTLQGPGSGALRILDGSNYNDVVNYGIIHWTTASTGTCRITGFTFDANNVPGNSGGANLPMMLINGNTASWQFDRNVVYLYNTSAQHYHEYVRGVIYLNTFHHAASSIGIYVFHEKWNNTDNGCGGGVVANGCGDASWAAATNLGSTDFLFFEDNTWDINGRNLNGAAANYATDGWSGARYVARFNTLTDVVFANHGTETAGRSRSARAHEIYNNKFTASTASIANIFGTRGGTGIAFQIYTTDNYPTTPGFLGGDGSMVSGTYYRWGCGATPNDCTSLFWRADPISITITSSGTTGTLTSTVAHNLGVGQIINISGDTGNHFNGQQTIASVPTSTTVTFTFAGCAGCSSTGSPKANSPWDQNTTGYMALDMVGAGKDGTIMGSGANPSPAWPNQAKEPWYTWTVQKKGSNAPATVASPMVLGTDLIDYNPSFNGSTQHGVGVGLRSARPASAALNDAWWATDDLTDWNTSATETYSALFGYPASQDGCLDKWNGTAWVNCSYVPYPYPHPARSAGGGGGGGGGGTFHVGVGAIGSVHHYYDGHDF